MIREPSAWLPIACLSLGTSLPSSAHTQQTTQDGDNAQGTAYTRRFSLTGQHRARFESLDSQFRPLLGANDQVLALQMTLNLEVTWPKWSLVAEVVDARAEFNDSTSLVNTTIVNTLEPIQLSLSRSWTGLLKEGARTSLRFGRMTMDLGSRRLIARNRYRNTMNSFVGVDWSWTDPGTRSFRAIYLEPMRPNPSGHDALLRNADALDTATRHTHIQGLVFDQQLRSLQGHLELSWLDLDAAETLDRRALHTAGARLQRSAAAQRWHYDLEFFKQTGRTWTPATTGDGLEHDARFVHLELGYTLASSLSPAVSLLFDEASGDDDPADAQSGRFDPLYGARRFDFGPTGIYGPFARANLVAPGIRFRLQPEASWNATFTYRSFALASARDAWTTTGLRDTTGQSGDDLGRQLEVQLSWQPKSARLRFDFGAAWWRKGHFVRQAAPALDASSAYLYASTTIVFFD